jgi:hypothetical protein
VLPWATVNAVIVKWKHLGETTRSGRPHKLTERGRRVVKRVAHYNRLSSVVTLTTEFQTASGSNVSTRTIRLELHEMGFRGRAAAHKSKITMRRRGGKLSAIGFWSSGNSFSGGMTPTSPSGSPTDESGFGGCQDASNVGVCPRLLVNVKKPIKLCDLVFA